MFIHTHTCARIICMASTCKVTSRLNVVQSNSRRATDIVRKRGYIIIKYGSWLEAFIDCLIIHVDAVSPTGHHKSSLTNWLQKWLYLDCSLGIFFPQQYCKYSIFSVSNPQYSRLATSETTNEGIMNNETVFLFFYFAFCNTKLKKS